tara:strand:+ start:49 stop:492 length:444 start_codon:yes stop_codon:yes gene_type:complete
MESQLSEKNSINPNLWGPTYWKVFHTTAFAFPDNPSEEDKNVYKNFYILFTKILPCEKCTQDARKAIKYVNWEQTLKSRDSLVKWTYLFHNDVNIKLNKKSIDFDYFLNNYIKDLSKKECKCDKTLETKIIILLVFLIFISFYILVQ